MPSFILNIVGVDQIGIIRKVSEIIARNDASWNKSRFVRLSGQFVGIVEIFCERCRVEDILKELEILTNAGFDVQVTLELEPEDRIYVPLHLIRLDVTAANRTGIVHEISVAICSVDYNIEDMHSKVESGSMCGQDIFRATFLLTGKVDEQNRARLLQKIENLSDDLLVEIDWGEDSQSSP